MSVPCLQDQDWDTALDELKHLQAFIDDWTFGSSLQTLQQRTWLIHWSLFVFFNHPKGKDLIIEMFLYQKQYLNAIQTICPWILRYLATAVIIRGSRRNVMKDLVKVLLSLDVYDWNTFLNIMSLLSGDPGGGVHVL